MRKAFSGMPLMFLLTFSLVLVSNIQPVEAIGTIYIRADGSIDPATAPISTSDNVTYTLTDDITTSGTGIIVERDNIAIEGADCTLQGELIGNGIYLSARSNVTIERTNIVQFETGIYIESSSECTVSANNVMDNHYAGTYLRYSNYSRIVGNKVTRTYNTGIILGYSSYNVVSGNDLTNNGADGICLYWNSNNNITGNTITNSGYSGFDSANSAGNTISGNTLTGNIDLNIQLIRSFDNTISENILTNSKYGIGIYDHSSGNTVTGNNITTSAVTGIEIKLASSGNKFYYNNIVNNTDQVHSLDSSVNAWDDGYPSGGNYWSDYNGTDADHDGIGDTPYIIDANNTDNYPLMTPYIIIVHDVAITGMRCKTVVGRGHLLYISVIVTNEGVLTETLNVTAYTKRLLQPGYVNFTQTETITVIGGTFSTVTFTWNTTGVAKGNQTIAAYASPVPGETDTYDNARTFGQIRITIFGDLNGDSKINIVDMAIAARAMGSMPGRPNWNPNADVNDDWAVNIIDVAKVAREFGKTDP